MKHCNKQRIVIVLGMHRSGTSSVACALTACGVSLGAHLRPSAYCNPRGFYEDLDINRLNDEMLQTLGMSWHSLKPIGNSDIKILSKKGFVQRAINLINQKTSEVKIFGFKDPRTARLLPFWIDVINNCENIETNYTLTIRNPISVAKSLEKRDGLSHKISYFLWLEHVITSIYHIRKCEYFIVDYDGLIKDPEKEIKKISRNLSLPIDNNRLSWYKNGFIDNALRHTQYTVQSILDDMNCPRLVYDVYSTIYTLITECDNDKIKHKLQDISEHWFNELEKMREAFLLIDECFKQINSLNQVVLEKDRQITILHQRISDYAEEITDLMDSTSWRITHPLRIIEQKKKWVLLVSRLAPSVIDQHGGLCRTTLKAANIVRRLGIRGMRTILIDLYSGKNNYDRWVALYDTLDSKAKEELAHSVSLMKQKPLISIVMPVYNPKPKWLIEAIESVRSQIYPHWELCIADDCSSDKEIRKILTGYQETDARIKVIFRKKNGHISAASNSALTLVKGEWIALLDHDDLLAEHALYWVVDAMTQHPEAQIIFSDEDKINRKGKRSRPYFKPDWNRELFYSQNLISHFGVYRTSLIYRIEGFREGLEGAQDYDLALRSLEQIRSEQIIHVPRVLYHWREHKESTALSTDAKPYAMLAGEKALNDHFQRIGTRGKIKHIGIGYRVYYDLPKPPPLVSIIIYHGNEQKAFHRCLKSILEKTNYPNYEIIVIKEDAKKSTFDHHTTGSNKFSKIKWLQVDNLYNYAAANNVAVEAAEGEYICLLNHNIEVINNDWLMEMVGVAAQPGRGAVGARLWYEDDTLHHGGFILGLKGVAGHMHHGLSRGQVGYGGRAALMQVVSAVSSTCLVIRRAIYQEVSGFDQENLPSFFHDIDFCLRVRSVGYKNIWTPFADLYFHQLSDLVYPSTSEQKDNLELETTYMENKWATLLRNDPYYNPNLTLEESNFCLASPPRVELFGSVDPLMKTLCMPINNRTHSDAGRNRDVT